MEKDKHPLFSIVIPTSKDKHLLLSTLDTLQGQEEKDFEILLMGEEVKENISLQYPDLSIQIHPMGPSNRGKIYNEAIRLAQGKYVQFLEPGERLLSKGGLSSIRALVEASQEPDIACSDFFFLDRGSHPHVEERPFVKKTLTKGVFPTPRSGSWFKRHSLLDLGGFDETLRYSAPFDLFCRLLLKEGMQSALIRRVMTEERELSFSLQKEVISFFETFWIVFRYFGIGSALKWMFWDNLKAFVSGSLRLFIRSGKGG